MATEVVMPKQGNSVESCIILEWKVKEGDQVAIGDVVCEAETDKSTIEVESSAEGTVLKLLYQAGEEVPVMQPMMIVGQKGEQVSVAPEAEAPEVSGSAPVSAGKASSQEVPVTVSVASAGAQGVSPRARAASLAVGIDPASISASGPKGRVIERDVVAAASARAPLSPVAKEALAQGGLQSPAQGSGIGGRILSTDLTSPVVAASAPLSSDASFPGPMVETPVKGVRKVTAKRMHESIATTAQFTMNAYADATALQSLRQRLKSSPAEMGLQKVTINDIILFAVAKTLKDFGYMNSHFLGDRMVNFTHVHLGCAVDTPRGLLVPVVKFADSRSLKQISDEFKRLASMCMEGKAQPDDLTGGTFTVTNLGAMGIDTFTPVLNVPEVAILGVGGISMRAIEDEEGDYAFIPHIALSLTIDHQGVDGAPAARFLKALCENIAAVDTLLAL
ncbi:MAG: dihydrolipoamide acetyltransferase family protein [Sphaerochaetaceae bacterium]|jgi:pyruvate dehydrogenase E2 component (dihydrolipoamide acetyltransferase)|nr:dihydrolipoamide acetyltransferase family protein [Sphaerochaetaceae bacterium]